MGLWSCGGCSNPLHNLKFAPAEPHGPNLAMDSTQLQLQPPRTKLQWPSTVPAAAATAAGAVYNA